MSSKSIGVFSSQRKSLYVISLQILKGNRETFSGNESVTERQNNENIATFGYYELKVLWAYGHIKSSIY